MASSKNPFKVGDHVELIERINNTAVPGAKAVVTRIKGKFVDVEWEDPKVARITANGDFYATRFKLVEPVSNAGGFILILKRDGKLLSSMTTRVYTTEKQALKGGEEMAAKHPGDEFLVFRATHSVVVAHPTVTAL